MPSLHLALAYFRIRQNPPLFINHQFQNEENEDEHARHSEFHSEYRFVCKNPGKLSQMDVMLIQAFPGIEHIEVQLLAEKKQSAQELTTQSHRIKF